MVFYIIIKLFMLNDLSRHFKMEFVNKIAEKLSFSKKEETVSAPVPRIPGFLDQLNDNKVQFETTLTNIKKISPDSYIYTYSLPNPDLPLGLLPGHHVVV